MILSILKDHANQYQLSAIGNEFSDLEVPYRVPVILLRGKFVPKRFLLISFLLSSLIISIGFYISNSTLAFIFIFTILMITIVIIVTEFYTFNKEIQQYL